MIPESGTCYEWKILIVNCIENLFIFLSCDANGNLHLTIAVRACCLNMLRKIFSLYWLCFVEKFNVGANDTEKVAKTQPGG